MIFDKGIKMKKEWVWRAHPSDAFGCAKVLEAEECAIEIWPRPAY